MVSQPDFNLPTRSKSFTQVVSTLVILISMFVIMGWYLDIAVLKSVLPDLVTMKFNTALGFLLTGISMRLFFPGPKQGINYKYNWQAAYILAVIVAMLGLCTLSQYIFSLDFGIDQLFFKEPPGAVYTSNLGRMAPATAASFLLTGVTLILFAKKTKYRFLLSQSFAFIIGTAAVFPLIGYIYNVKALYGFMPYTTMAAHTAAAFLLISAGLLCAYPEDGVIKIFTSNSTAGFLLRRLSAFIVLTLVALGWLHLKGELKGFYGPEIGIALLVTISSIVGLIIIYISCKKVYFIDLERERVKNELEASYKTVDEKAAQLSAKIGELEEVKKAILNVNDDLNIKQAEVESSRENISRAYQTTRNIIDNAPFGIYIVTENGEIEYVNPAMLKIAGASREEFMGINALEFTAYKEIGLSEKIHGCILGKHFRMDAVEYTSHFGKKTTVRNFTGICINEEGARKAVVIVEDITQRRHLERLKDEFVSTVSHELRTPLSIIKEGISLILDKVPGDINDKQNKILGTANNNIDRLTRIINDLLNISKIESGRMELRKQQFDLTELIKQAANLFQAAAKEKGLELKLNLPEFQVEIIADPDRINEVLINLISNALKFTDRGYIEVYLKEVDKEIECSVRDTGIGISGDDLPKVFNKFEQFHRLAGGGPKGTGLGLSICKGIVEMHHGKIWVESKLGEGTKFVFTIPKQKEPTRL